jgi:hypothetical protein
MSEKPLVVYTLATPDDLGFIYNSYLKSQRKYFDPMEQREYFNKMHARLERFLISGGVVMVARNPDDDQSIVGWAAFHRRVTEERTVVRVFYVYVKNLFRNFGIARSMLGLLRQIPGEVTMELMVLTPNMRRLNNRYSIVYNPCMLEEMMEERTNG